MRSVWLILMAAVLLPACGGPVPGADSSESADPTTDTTTASGTADGDPEGEAPTAAVVSATTVAVTTTTTTTTTVAAAVADAISIEQAVDVRVGTATSFSPVTDPSPVAAGDTVRTDQTGFAEIAYFDGSRTRLDIDTEFTVLELVDNVDGSTVRTKLDAGRTWHRVQEFGEGGEFSVETSVATAVVQGTAFSVDCRFTGTCTFMVVEGALRIDLPDGTSIDLVAPAALAVDAQGAGESVPVPFDGAFGDEWLLDNGGRDADAGFTSPAEVFQEHGPSYGSITGTFTGTRTIVQRGCDAGYCQTLLPEGDVAEAEYVFVVDCSEGVPCVGRVTASFDDGQSYLDAVELPGRVDFDGLMLTWSSAGGGGACVFGDGTEVGSAESTVVWVVTPTAAQVVDGQWVVTGMTGEVTALSETVDGGICPPSINYTGARAATTSEIEFVRTD